MTDLTAYEQALVERVARALFRAENFDPNEPSPNEPLPCPPWRRHYPDARAALTALGLLGPSRTAWIAPVEPNIGMVRALTASWDDELKLFAAKWAVGTFREDYQNMIAAAMRDAHLKEGRQ